MARRVPAAGIRAAFRWQRLALRSQPLRVDRTWMKNLKFPIKQNPIGSSYHIVSLVLPLIRADEPQSTRAANVWSSYLEHADKWDKDLVERWKGDMDGILIFVRAHHDHKGPPR